MSTEQFPGTEHGQGPAVPPGYSSPPVAGAPQPEPERGPGPYGKSWAWIFKSLLVLALVSTVLVGGGGYLLYWKFSQGLPKIITVADYHPLTVTQIIASGAAGGNASAASEASSPSPQATPTVAATGAPAAEATAAPYRPQPIAEFYKERRYVIPYDKIPDIVVKAFISAEDDKFFEHPGFNISSMIRASIANFRAGHVVQGGSTITQQVAKSLLLTPERSFGRKFKELILAAQIEKSLTKQQILYLYLNQIYLGHGAYGVEAAAKTYFRKDIWDVDVAEAAILAGLPQAPSSYSPVTNPRKAKDRQTYVLGRMVENKFITSAQRDQALQEPLRVYRDEDINAKYAAYYVEYVRQYLINKYGEKKVYEEGLNVTVPTRPDLTLAASKNLREGLAEVDKRNGYRGPLIRLTNPDETARYLAAVRARIIESRLGYRLLEQDGKFDLAAAMRDAKIASDADLLQIGESYPAVVTGFDDAKKSASVVIGTVHADLQLSGMKWARPAYDQDKPYASRPEPSLPSKVLAKGDVVLVRVEGKTLEGANVSLDQAVQRPGFYGEAAVGPPSLKLNVPYNAVVAGFDEKKNSLQLDLGTAGTVSVGEVKWNRPDDESTIWFTDLPEPAGPGQVFTKGEKLTLTPVSQDGQTLSVQVDKEGQLQGAVFSMEARTGYVIALEGGYDFQLSEFNRATQAQRQVASSFKPLVYSAALEHGFTPASIIVDSPIVYEDTKDQTKWKPLNFEKKFYGDTSFREALIKSRNVVTVKIAQAIGLSSLHQFIDRIGLQGKFPPAGDLSMSLGNDNVSLFELSKAYALFPRLGRKVNPIFVTKVTDADGRTLEETKPETLPAKVKLLPLAQLQKQPPSPEMAPTVTPSEGPDAAATAGGLTPASSAPSSALDPNDPDQVMDPRVAYVMTQLMKDVVNYGTGYEAKALNRAAAGKTGTNEKYFDAWFMGFTPEVLTGVWVGHDKNEVSIGPGETGARAALPIWLGYMRDAVKGYPDSDFTIPPGIVFESIDPATGKLTPPNAAGAIREAFIEGTQPTERSDQKTVSPEKQTEFFKEDVE